MKVKLDLFLSAVNYRNKAKLTAKIEMINFFLLRPEFPRASVITTNPLTDWNLIGCSVSFFYVFLVPTGLTEISTKTSHCICQRLSESWEPIKAPMKPFLNITVM